MTEGAHQPGTQSFSFREVVAPLFRELSTSFSSRSMQRRVEEGGLAQGTALDQHRPSPLTTLPNTSILDRNQQVRATPIHLQAPKCCCCCVLGMQEASFHQCYRPLVDPTLCVIWLPPCLRRLWWGCCCAM